MKGLIIKSLGGLYTVKTENNTYQGRPRGIFRKDDFKPVVGDICEISFTDHGETVIEKVYERKNLLIRPPLANIDKLFFVVSTVEPNPNYLILDQLISIAEKENISPNLVITKTDLKSPEKLWETYNNIYPFYIIDYDNKETVLELEKAMIGAISAFSGNSGVGKSTILNAIDNRFEIETGEISNKLGRGRHTTREVSLYQLGNGGYIADTPGFSSIDFNRVTKLLPEEIATTFIEFQPFLGRCKFNNCLHDKEIGCAIKNAVENKGINLSRYKNYLSILEQSKKAELW